MTTTRTAKSVETESATATERRAEAVAWVTRQLRFERLITSLEGPAVSAA